MDKISIITPIYKGVSYLSGLSDMIEKCAIEAKETVRIEWVIVNDDPTTSIEYDFYSAEYSHIYIDTKINRGIQGARVAGLKESTGDYILFLDQDDLIYPDWARSQYNAIGDADAVVCDAINFGVAMYNNETRPTLSECITREYNIGKYIGFNVGQTLIRKTSIPKLWMERLLATNCCDDHYLWLCMYASGCVFIENRKLLFEHCRTGKNQSSNTGEWVRSTHEMLHIILEEKIFSNEDAKKLILSREHHIEKEADEAYFSRLKADYYHGLVLLNESNKLNNSSFLCHGGIVIYGYRLGIHLARVLMNKGCDLIGVIDKEADSISSDIRLFTINKTPQDAKYVISTLLSKENKTVIRDYYRKYRSDIVLVDAWEFLNSVRNME